MFATQHSLALSELIRKYLGGKHWAAEWINLEFPTHVL